MKKVFIATPRYGSDGRCSAMATAAVHMNITDATATVAVPHITRPLKVMHLSDSHVSLASDKAPHSDRMHAAFANGHGKHAGGTVPKDIFTAQLNTALGQGADLIVHTGDFVNFPSAESVAFVKDALDSAGIPYFYISGNHDCRLFMLDTVCGSNPIILSADIWCS